MKKILRTALLAFVLFVSYTAQGQQNYIFYNATYGYLINNNGNPGVSNTFTKSAIWVANNTMGGTSRNVHSYTDNTKYFTGSNGSNWGNGSFSLGTSNDQWRIVNNYLNRAGNNRGYVRYNGSGFIVNSSDNGQNFTGLAITINSSTPSNPTISISASNGLTNGGIQLTGNITGTYTPTYYYASVRNYNNNNTQTYYWTENADATTTQPTGITNWADATKTWAVTTGSTYASVSSDGLVTITGNPTGNIVVTLTVTKGGYEGTQTFTLTRAAVAAGTQIVTEISQPTVNPVSAALYYNEGSQTFTTSATATRSELSVPAHTTISASGNTYYYYNGNLYASAGDFGTPTVTYPEVTISWALSGDAASYLTRTPATGTSTSVTHTSQSPSDLTVTLTVTASAAGAASKTATATITAYGPMAAPTISRTGNSISLATASAGATIYYTTDGSTPTADNGTAYAGPFDLVTSPTTVKAIAIRDGHSSAVTDESFSIMLAAPTISVSNTGLATITADDGATIHYTTDGSTPTAESAIYTSAVQLTNPQTIKAIAVRTGYTTSDVSMGDYITTGVSGNTVILDDREDHTWTYYSDKPDSDYPNQLLSPDPRNVKIIYDGNGGKVSYNESASEFVYYKTIEKIGSAYTYKVIPNPFSKRPIEGTGDTRWRGFGGWEIVSGGEFISGKNNGDVLSLEETLTLTGLDAGYTKNCISATIELRATWVQAYVSTVNAAGDITSRPTALIGSTYETNFIVILDNRNHTVSGTGRVTISNRYPDGTAGGTGTVNGCTSVTDGTKVEFVNIDGTFTEQSGPMIVGRGCTGTVDEVTGTNTNRIKNIRLESGTYSYVHPMQGMGDNANNRGTFVFGCDYDRANVTNVQPYGDNSKLRIVVFTAINGSGGHANNSTDDLLNITIKSGYYGFTSDYTSWQSNKNDGWGLGIGGNTDNYSDTYVVPDENGITRSYSYSTKPPQNTMSFYVGPTRGGGKGGGNVLLIEGGELSSVNGGGTTTPDDFIRFDMRMTGGWVKGAIYGGASAVDCNGSSKIVITGGEVNSWIGGGCNGTDISAGAGATSGTIYIYAGGNAQIRSHNSDGVYNNAWGLVNHIEGGQIFGGGRGMGAAGSYSGSATNAYIVVADDSYVEQNVYGGSCHGVTQYGRVYILGGIVGKKVFGGSFEPTSTNATWQSKDTHVRMYGGFVKGGIYGGNDADGTVTQDAELLIYGGTVGEGNAGNGIFGGGYGETTTVSGDIVVKLGECNAASGVTVYGDVYGGSAMGKVNTNSSNTTTVSLYKGTIYGGLYGGGYGPGGEAANVNGAVQVNVFGGSVLCSSNDPYGVAGTGSVFGCNNISGAPQSTVKVDIYNTDQPASGYALHAVYGGGNKSPYNNTPVVTIHGCSNSIEYVYGGGNATDVRGTNVTIWGGTIGNAFAGGNGAGAGNPGANITHNGTKLYIHGGQIGAAFGGSNERGTINGGIIVNVDYQPETATPPTCVAAYTQCPMLIGELYGGGNKAPIVTSTDAWITPVVNIACEAKIGMLFGGAKAADYGGNIDLVVNGGTFEKVFGGNNQGGTISGSVTVTFNGGSAKEVYGGCNESGTINGSITVNIDSTNTTCTPRFYVENVYGGGNLAKYTGNPAVNIINGTVRQNVYGGGFGSSAIVTGTPVVTVGVIDGDKTARVLGHVFGGGNAAAITGNTSVNILYDSYIKGHVFGGGNAALVSANTFVLLRDKAKVYGNIYGGGNMGEVGGNTKVVVNGQ